MTRTYKSPSGKLGTAPDDIASFVKTYRGTSFICSQAASGKSIAVWAVGSLINRAKSAPVRHVAISRLRESLAENLWFENIISCEEVLHHMTGILKSDLRNPIIIGPNYELYDGAHRLAKAILLGKKRIRARRLSEIPSPNLILDNLDYHLFSRRWKGAAHK